MLIGSFAGGGVQISLDVNIIVIGVPIISGRVGGRSFRIFLLLSTFYYSLSLSLSPSLSLPPFDAAAWAGIRTAVPQKDKYLVS